MASLGAYAKEKGIKYFLVSFVDLFGAMRAKIVPATAIDTIARRARALPASRVVRHDSRAPRHPGRWPIRKALIQLPWKPEVAWVTGDLIMGGRPVEQDPRHVLKRLIKRQRHRTTK